MASRPILGGYGPDSNQPQQSRATNGGKMPVKDVMGYCPPYGPTNINDPQGPGVHGTNHSNSQQRATTFNGRSGSPGLGGKNFGNSGSQGSY